MEICKSLQRLKNPEVISTRNVMESLFPKVAKTVIANMFPNVHDPLINYIRKKLNASFITRR